MFLRLGLLFAITVCGLFTPAVAAADNAAFDLPGPRVEVRVTRGGQQLPSADVPNLQVGDRLWVHPDFPESQSAHYLLIVAFLRGTTNPPPENWFTRIECWNKRVRQEGEVVTVPKGAEQALLFLAPETGGDFSTLRSNVRGKPGAFVRASQDLVRASLDRSRLNIYLAAVKQAANEDPDKLKQETTLLARSLSIKLDSDCFKKPVDEQAACLTQNSSSLVLDDPHSQSMVAELASNGGVDLIGQISSTPWAGAGYYSPYVGAIVDVARLLTAFHTADYQYIPALAVPKADQLNLLLNTAPSFEKPKSVLVIGLPAIEPVQLPPLRAVDAKGVYCASNPSLVLPADGAPLVFSTSLGQDWMLHLWSKSGASLDLPVKPDATRGGFVIDKEALEKQGSDAHSAEVKLAQLPADLSGTLRGKWGFDSFEGPTFHLRTAHPATWTVASADQSALIVGRDDTLHLKSEAAVCVDSVSVTDGAGKEIKTTNKATGPDELQVQIALKDAAAGPLTMKINQFALPEADKVDLHSYAEAGHLESFTINAGDRQGVLKGTRLDEVARLELAGIQFAPSGLTRVDSQDQLQMSAPASADVKALRVGDADTAQVTLKDERVLKLPATVEASRPKITLISKSVHRDTSTTPVSIQLGSDNELPLDAKLSFSLKSDTPQSFPHDEKIEVATQDDSVHAVLTLADGTLTLQDSQTVLATLNPQKQLGPSAFGPLRFRPVAANGEKGDWQPLATLVRLPAVEELRCPGAEDKQCTLQGSGLYLLDAVSSDPQFQQSTSVPDGFSGSSLNVPRPDGQGLYVKLRDDPSAVNKLQLPVLPQQP
jgi:hypothetical protein